MPDNGNGDWLPKPVRIVGWLWIVVIVLMMLYLVLFNPGNTFGESELIPWLGFWFPIYPGQPAALQFLGTFIAAMGAMMHLTERRLTGFLRILALLLILFGALVMMAGQALQGIREQSSVPTILFVLLTYFVLIWFLVAASVGINRLYSWLKSRRQSGG